MAMETFELGHGHILILLDSVRGNCVLDTLASLIVFTKPVAAQILSAICIFSSYIHCWDPMSYSGKTAQTNFWFIWSWGLGEQAVKTTFRSKFDKP